MRTLNGSAFAAAALAVSTCLMIADAAGQAVGLSSAAIRQDQAGVAHMLDRVEQHLREGRPVAARALLVRVMDLTDAAPERAATLLAQANAAIGQLEPLEVSLQRAEVALEDGDLRVAEQYARSVARSAAAGEQQVARANELLDVVSRRRAELVPKIGEILAAAQADFDAGRYAQAMAGFTAVERAGVPLTPQQHEWVSGYMLRLVSMASPESGMMAWSRGEGAWQPGVIRRREDEKKPVEAQPPAGEPQPPPAPESAPPAVSQPVPVPPTAPAAQQPPSELPAVPPPPPPKDHERQALEFEARSLLAQADREYEARNLNLAQGIYYRLATEFREFLTGEQQRHVEQRLAEVRARLASPLGPPSPEDVLIQDQIARGQAEATFQNDLAQARRAMETGNTQEARTLAARARLTLNNARRLFPESVFENYDRQVSDLLAMIDREEERMRRAAAEQRERERQQREAEAARAQRAERDRKIVELIDRARAYQAEMRYAEALQAVEQLLLLDPINPTGLLLRDLLTDITMYRRYNDIYNKKQMGYVLNALDNQDASIPPPGIVNYPEDWPRISFLRGEPVQFAESPENRRTYAELGGRRHPEVVFEGQPLADVFRYLEVVTGQNFDVDWRSLERAGITPDTQVFLRLRNVSGRTVLDRVLEKVSGGDRHNRADWTVIDGVVTIASEERLRQNTVLVIYDVRDLLIEVPDHRDVPRIDLQQALQSAGRRGVDGSGQSPFADASARDAERGRRDRQERLDDLINIITTTVDYEGWDVNGGDTGRIQPMVNQGNLIITNTPKNQRAVAGLLAKLREIRAMQINVETRFLLVSQDWFEQIGLDIDLIINADNNQVRFARGLNPTIQPSDFFNPDGTPRRVVGSPAVGPIAGPVPTVNQGVIPPRPWSPIGFHQDSLGLAAGLAPSRGIAANILGQAPALGIAGQFLDDIQVDFLIRATQADRRSISLTAPRLTFTNGQTANIYVATQQAFVSDLEPVVGDSAVGFDPTVGVVTEGVTLLVEGTVTADRRYVTMNVDAGVARIDGFAQQAVTAVAGGQLVSSAETQSFIQLPRITVTRVRTTVTVPDQGTILLGGQRLVTEFEVETGVPVLSKIPILNRFFTNRIETKEEQTLLILIKPTILIQNEEEERHFPGLLESLRAGVGG